MAKDLTVWWLLRRVVGLPAICAACLHPRGRDHQCDWKTEPPASKQWKEVGDHRGR